MAGLETSKLAGRGAPADPRVVRRCGSASSRSREASRSMPRRSGARASEPVEVRKPGALDGVDGLILPGGESTTLLHLMDAWDFGPALRAFHAEGRPLFGTCAGLIVLAREVREPAPALARAHRRLRGAQQLRPAARVLRSCWRSRWRRRWRRPRSTAAGRSAWSSSARRASAAPGPGSRSWPVSRGDPVLAREGPVLVATFHPELTDDLTVHRYFCRMAEARVRRRLSRGRAVRQGPSIGRPRPTLPGYNSTAGGECACR